jgi:hypothetical protein
MKFFSIFFLLVVSLAVAAVSHFTFLIFILKGETLFYLKCSDQLVNYSKQEAQSNRLKSRNPAAILKAEMAIRSIPSKGKGNLNSVITQFVIFR